MFTGESPKKAMKTIQKAVDKLTPGDTLWLLPGEYQQGFKTKRSGKVDAPITLSGTASAKLVGFSNSRGKIVSIKHSNVRLNGFTINGLLGSNQLLSNFANKLIYVSAFNNKPIEGIQLTSLRLKNAKGECIRFKNVSFSTISRNDISECGVEDYRFNRGKQNGEAIYLGTAPEQLKNNQSDQSNHNQIYANTIVVEGSECVDIKEGSNFNVVRHNFCSKSLASHSGAISIRSSSNVIEYNTIVNNVGAGVRIGADFPGGAINNLVQYNTLIENQHSALKVMDWPQKGLCNNRIMTEEGNGNIKARAGIDKIAIERCNHYVQ